MNKKLAGSREPPHPLVPNSTAKPIGSEIRHHPTALLHPQPNKLVRTETHHPLVSKNIAVHPQPSRLIGNQSSHPIGPNNSTGRKTLHNTLPTLPKIPEIKSVENVEIKTIDHKTSTVSEISTVSEKNSKPISSDFIGRRRSTYVSETKSLGDLVLYNDEGKPFIDVDRLIYNPRLKAKKEIKEKISWFGIDAVFIFSNFLSMVCSAYVISIGLSLATWSSSIKSVSLYAYDRDKSEIQTIFKVVALNNKISSERLGFTLILCALINTVNVFIGIFSCIYGYKVFLIQHITFDAIILVVQFSVAVIVTLGGSCEPKDLAVFQRGFEEFIYLQSEVDLEGSTQPLIDDEYYASLQIDLIQTSMKCCGASNWSDYTNPDIVKKSYLGVRKTIYNMGRVIPFSCCKDYWVRNLQCAEGVHEWASPKQPKEKRLMFRERIYQQGCVPKVWLTCIRLLFMAGPMLLYNAIFNGILLGVEILSVVQQIRSYALILKEIKDIDITNRKLEEMERHEGDTRDELEESDLINESLIEKVTEEEEITTVVKRPLASIASLAFGKKGVKELKAQLALPTEDEIHYIKGRSGYSKFETKMKHTPLGKMMSNAKKSVLMDRDVSFEALIPKVQHRRNTKPTQDFHNSHGHPNPHGTHGTHGTHGHGTHHEFHEHSSFYGLFDKSILEVHEYSHPHHHHHHHYHHQPNPLPTTMAQQNQSNQEVKAGEDNSPEEIIEFTQIVKKQNKKPKKHHQHEQHPLDRNPENPIQQQDLEQHPPNPVEEMVDADESDEPVYVEEKFYVRRKNLDDRKNEYQKNKKRRKELRSHSPFVKKPGLRHPLPQINFELPKFKVEIAVPSHLLGGKKKKHKKRIRYDIDEEYDEDEEDEKVMEEKEPISISESESVSGQESDAKLPAFLISEGIQARNAVTIPTEIKTPVTIPKRKSLVTLPKRKSPVTVTKRKSLVTVTKRKSPVTVPKRKSPVTIPKRKSPVTLQKPKTTVTLPIKRKPPVTIPKRKMTVTIPKRTAPLNQIGRVVSVKTEVVGKLKKNPKNKRNKEVEQEGESSQNSRKKMSIEKDDEDIMNKSRMSKDEQPKK